MSDVCDLRASDLIRRLSCLAKRRGWSWPEQAGKGSHRKIWLNERFSVIPMHAGDMKPGTLRAIPRDLAVTEDDLEG